MTNKPSKHSPSCWSRYAVDEAGHVFISEGGDDYNGAKCWVAINPTI